MTDDVFITPDERAPDQGYAMKISDRVKCLLMAAALASSAPAPILAADYASEISAYRRAHNLSAVTIDGKLNAFAMTQAQAMSTSGKVSHEVGGVFSARVAKLRKMKAAENIAAGFLTFSETLKQWEDSAGHRENLLMPGAKKVGVAAVSNPGSPYRRFWAMVITD
ncbi:MAG: CAP domain-containing protein [Tardiphaga sp.]